MALTHFGMHDRTSILEEAISMKSRQSLKRLARLVVTLGYIALDLA